MSSPARITLAAASFVLLAGCATFTDDEVAARVGDVELSEDELAGLVRESVGDEAADTAPMQAVNEILNNFVLDRVLRSDLAASGSPLDEFVGDLTNVSLQESAGQAFAAWQSNPPTPVDPARVRAKYELGPIESNITCTAHILVETEARASEVLDRLDAGDAFATLAEEYSFDTGSAAQGGTLPCDTTGGFSAAYIPEYVEAAIDAEIGVPVGPVASQFGFHVILLRPFDDLGADELDPLLAQPQIRFDFVADDIDVYVNPRYGAFDAARGVVPLG